MTSLLHCKRNFDLNLVLLILLSANNVNCLKNLFLPKTGDISGVNPVVVGENLSNITNFQGLLGAGRSLAYPFSAGVLVAISTLANENNWKVSDAGFAQVLNIPRDEILDSYGTLLETLETDENVTLSNTLFSFRPSFSPSEALTETLMTEVREVTWTRETWKQTYQLMVEHLGNVTNEKIDTLLIPSVTKIGTPFRKTTEAVITSTFHYINGWQQAWTDGELGTFSGNDGIPYLIVEDSFLVAEEDEFTAVSVPLEGGSKSMVFVLPHVNITKKYFRQQTDAEEDETTDIVPFPKNWKPKKLRLRVPAFNTTDVDQYGQELEQNGMRETFCTILRDIFGRYPYYLRPMVQVNFLDLNEDFLELASATGVAVEKFQSLFTIIAETGKEEEEQKSNGGNNSDSNQTSTTASPSAGILQPNKIQIKASPDLDINPTSSVPSATETSETSSTIASTSDSSLAKVTTVPGGSYDDILTLSFDRPFLWYLNDAEVGPIFFGTVETLLNPAFLENTTESGNEEPMGTTMPPVSGDEMGNSNNSTGNGTMSAESENFLSEIEKSYLWSCRSFVPTATDEKSRLPPLPVDGSFEDNNATLPINNSSRPSRQEHTEKW